MRFASVGQVLAVVQHPLGRRMGSRWRTTCPIHRGDNTQAFAYDDEKWTCHAACGSGGIRKLAVALGLVEDRPQRGSGCEPDPFLLPGQTTTDVMPVAAAPKVHRRLEDAQRAWLRTERQIAWERHRVSLCVLRDTDDVLKTVRLDAEGWPIPEHEPIFQGAGHCHVEALQQLRAAHAHLVILAAVARHDPEAAFDPCEGDCYRRGDDPRPRGVPTVEDVIAWVQRQDRSFQEAVQRELRLLGTAVPQE